MNLNYPDLDFPFGYSGDVLFPEEAASEAKRASHGPRHLSTLASHPGDWHYATVRRSKWIVGGAIVISVAAHGMLFFGLNGRPKPHAAPATDTIEVVLIEMPKVKDLDETPEESGDLAETPAGVDAPMLPDIPPTVVIDGAFIQKMDMSSLIPRPNLDGAKLSSIPAVINHGGAGGPGGMKNVFDLASLDRAPSAVFQPPPRVTTHGTDVNGSYTLDLQFIVTSKGECVEVRVMSSTAPQFNDAAVAAVSKWKFKPGMKGGRPVNTRMRQPMTFKPGGE